MLNARQFHVTRYLFKCSHSHTHKKCEEEMLKTLKHNIQQFKAVKKMKTSFTSVMF